VGAVTTVVNTTITPADGLDAAWRDAEAALPAGCRFEGVRRSILAKTRWVASYSDGGGWFNFYGDTPVAALRALVSRLADPGLPMGSRDD
jgi:hypothetical protein